MVLVRPSNAQPTKAATSHVCAGVDLFSWVPGLAQVSQVYGWPICLLLACAPVPDVSGLKAVQGMSPT